MALMHETVTEKVYCACSNPCLYYHKVYNWFQEGKVSEEVWDKFCMACLKNLLDKSKNI